MTPTRNGTVGRVTVDLELANYVDLAMVEQGMLPADKVRRVKTTAIVDTGSTRLVLPPSAIDQLGLSPSDKTIVRYADHRRVERPVVYGIWVTLQGRSGHFSAIVEPDRTDALIGAIIMEELDFLVDCQNNTIIPREPASTISEVE